MQLGRSLGAALSQEVDAFDKVATFLKDVMDHCLITEPSHRLTATQINNRVSAFVTELNNSR